MHKRDTCTNEIAESFLLSPCFDSDSLDFEFKTDIMRTYYMYDDEARKAQQSQWNNNSVPSWVGTAH